ncbi:MAG TPA: hypothetical protein VFT28_14980 [Gemmatimonadales bacterium]|nr:hypothetical protein [Gemmatimonadales bacterium]
MGIDYHLYRRFHTELLEAEDTEGRRRVLAAWTGRISALFGELAPLRHRESPPLRERAGESAEWYGPALYALYAVGRVSDFLLELGCPPGEPPFPGVTGGRTPAPDELALHERFFRATGLRSFTRERSFSPFHHEIFAVVPDEGANEVTVEQVLWPGFRFGDLLFCRAGVRVRAPARLIDPVAATTSTLYFTSRRAPRNSSDLSHGWGSNSQWRTRFHRFYQDAAGLHLNWDGQIHLGPDHRPGPDEHPDIEQRRTLLLHRCLVTAPLPTDEHDRFPFEDRLTLTRSTWPLTESDLLPAAAPRR